MAQAAGRKLDAAPSRARHEADPSFEDSTSPEFYALEREAIFKRAWLKASPPPLGMCGPRDIGAAALFFAAPAARYIANQQNDA